MLLLSNNVNAEAAVGDPIEETQTLAPAAETYTVTIDPNGGTINDESQITEVTGWESCTLPYSFSMNLENTGHSSVGYTVEGTLLDSILPVIP